MIETTITMKTEKFDKLDKYCKDLKISKSKFLILCMNKYIPKLKKTLYRHATLKYQSRSSNWKIVHVFIHEATHAKYTNVDRLHNITLSHMIAKAFDVYCEIIYDELLHECDVKPLNKIYYDYFSAFNGYLDGHKTFTYIWGKSNCPDTTTICQISNDKRLILRC
ncbi:MAG: hypothetical protein JXK07_09180 [Spirochaetes bacterium]|nr:hypothetical protein [Spirochaetota bacterium]MBN2772150.1 hypothetical protein [Spirochaetota bacterium]